MTHSGGRGPHEVDLGDESEQLVLSDLINRVLDKGIVITANVQISIADINLVQLDLRLFLTSVATQDKRANVSVRSDSGA